MIVHALLSFVAVQEPFVPASPPPSPIARVEIQPGGGEVQIGGTLKFTARALDPAGQVVPRAEIAWFVGGDIGNVDSTGVFTGGYQGYARVTAVGFIRGQQGSQVFGEALVHVLPEPPASIALDNRPARVVAGSRLTITATPFSRHGDRRSDPVTFTSSNPRVAAVSADGRLRAVAAGRATVTAKAGPATETLVVQVLPNTVARLTVEPAAPAVRTGDVVQFAATARNAAGRSLGAVAVEWAVVAGAGLAQIDPAGAFVAELPGTYTVTLDVNDTVAFLTLGGGGSPTLAGSSRTFGVDSLATIGVGAELSLTNSALNGAGGVTNQGTLRLQNTTVNAGVQNAGLVIARSSTAFNGALSTVPSPEALATRV